MLPDVAYAVALAALRDMTPARLRVLLDGRPAGEVYGQLLSGDPALVDALARLGGSTRSARPDEALDMEVSWGASGSLGAMERTRAQARASLRAWRLEAERTPVDRRWRELQGHGIGVVRRGDAGYPTRLLRARQVPELLYVRGRLDQAAFPCVGIVGTRRATHYGREIASELGRDLGDRGVVVVSGLARGIDAAAHSGVVAGGARPSGPIAVVGGGVDVVYPRENRRLWDEVLTLGGIVSEAPPGAPPESWRFPLRNRIIAALSQVLVVVESSRQGGAIHTVLAADAYGVPVLAVPGSVRSPQSEGTNAIIQEGGAGVVLDVHDILAVLSLVCEDDGTPISFSSARPGGDRRQPVSGSWRSDWGGRSAGGGRAGAAGGGGTSPGLAADPSASSARASKSDPGAAEDATSQQALDLGLSPATPASPRVKPARPSRESDRAGHGAIAACTPEERVVVEAVDYTATITDLICHRTKLDLGVVALALDRLEELGLVRHDGAGWIRV
jgi:DNA processing protein